MTMLTLLLAAATAVHAADKPAEIDGKKLFTQKCASCHAATGKGNPAMAKMFKTELAALDLTAPGDADQAKIVADGKGKMPAFKAKLKDAEMAAVLDYVKTLAAKPAEKKK